MGGLLRQCVLAVFFFCSAIVRAEPSARLYSATPPLLSKASDPLVMLVMSVDHELFKKAYSDYSDLDGDGILDSTYNDTFDYLGYFDNRWCYRYDTTTHRYRPEVLATGVNTHFCTTSAAPWSGNFLNWATMARIDVLRKVMSGGKRVTDTADTTVLERAYLPRDIHSFVKVYRGTPELPSSYLTPFTQNEISLCNLATTENGAPMLRVANQAWPRWASTEVRQCQWENLNSPSLSYKLAEHQVHVEVCVEGKDAEKSERCKAYNGGKYKPVGLLQRYGEGGNIRFGLLSGSYDKNTSGGVLRRNITRLAGNTNPSENELDVTTGVFNSAVKGIIFHLNQFRIANYSYAQNKYTDCYPYGITRFSNASSKRCSNWGNPLAELYLEALRYFSAQEQPSSEYDTGNDHLFVPGLTKESWQNPQDSSNACAQCAIVLLTTGLNSFDTDQYGSAGGVTGILGTADVDKLTDKVGDMEAEVNPDVTFPGLYLADKSGGDKLCEETEISRLSDIRGICPEQPQLEGGYQLSGLAWHGWSTDLREDLSGKQSVKTYAVQLADNVPSFALNVGGKQVTFQPVCLAHSNRSECSLVDVTVAYEAADRKSGKLLFTWEDSLWGNDYDYDASSSISYCIASACSPAIGEFQVKLTVRQEAKNAGAETWYSYTVTGTDQDGLALPLAVDAGNAGSQGSAAPVSKLFAAVGDTATQLPKPLWFAAKYGGFIDLDGDGSPGHDANGDGVPDTKDTREWDNKHNITGSLGGDGLPDNYFFARNPSQLELHLGQVFKDISAKTASATNVALVANESKGKGAIYQALFQPKMEWNKKTVTWGGMLHALFVDDNGWLREDSNQDDQLGDYNTDAVVDLIYDPNAGQTFLQRYKVVDQKKEVFGPLLPAHKLQTLWDAREMLSKVSDTVNQRTYTASAMGGRHILTWLDSDNDQQVDMGEARPFDAVNFIGKAGYLGVAAGDVANVVNYIRGEEINGFRSRLIDYDQNGSEDVWRLGDIVHSTPAVATVPEAGYDERFEDASYGAFKAAYQHRRHVVYVGANDGLIHAFNGGFYDAKNHRYATTGNQGQTAHALGAELWAYAPMNLLPHLRWLTEPDYPHVYYMDGEPQLFDVNIFAADADHPGGWGTILVTGMRLGGGPITVTAEDHTRTMRSGYVVLDVTNPEKPPKILAEITDPALGFTVSRPVLVKQRQADVSGSWSNPLKNNWYLVFASGPTGAGETGIRNALEKGSSDQKLHIFAYDLVNQTLVNGFDPFVTAMNDSYGGDMAVADWDQDYQDDAVYFGAIDTGGDVPGGGLWRIHLDSTLGNSDVSELLNTSQPFTSAPLTIKDGNDFWVYGGTGRQLVAEDNTHLAQQTFYGVKEPANDSGVHTFGQVSKASLVDMTQVVVKNTGDVRVKTNSGYQDFMINGETITRFKGLKAAMADQPGWKVDLVADNVVPAEKNVTRAKALFSMILFTGYQPSENSCQMDGRSHLYGMHYITGTATPSVLLDDRVIDPGKPDEKWSLNNVSLGGGYASSPAIYFNQSGAIEAITQGGGGSLHKTVLNDIFSPSGRLSWQELFDFQ
ncbi:pilus assembly protein [Candidatus Sororendozoicomonas aggregata]|uniref:pilus assembly protein n=1 Tax=Candidatus Sororendozoicomonas aggregata TaxID=3073239 RepID=UPI002ED639D4